MCCRPKFAQWLETGRDWDKPGRATKGDSRAWFELEVKHRPSPCQSPQLGPGGCGPGSPGGAEREMSGRPGVLGPTRHPAWAKLRGSLTSGPPPGDRFVSSTGQRGGMLTTLSRVLTLGERRTLNMGRVGAGCLDPTGGGSENRRGMRRTGSAGTSPGQGGDGVGSGGRGGVGQTFSGLGLISGAAKAGARLGRGSSNSSTEVMLCTSWMEWSFPMPAQRHGRRAISSTHLTGGRGTSCMYVRCPEACASVGRARGG